MELDLELRAMHDINEILSHLEADSKSRVLQWAIGKHGAPIPAKANFGKVDGSENRNEVEREFSDVATLFDSANPTTEPEKVLVVGYWIQVIQGRADIEAQSINSELKNLGHGVGNITRALDNLVDRKPRLVIQTRKSGTTKQARKKFRLTTEGIRKVIALISEGDDDR